MRSKYLAIGTGLLLVAGACSLHARSGVAPLGLVTWPTPRTCPTQRTSSITTAEKQAILCAEAFVRRNGYTLASAIGDSAQIASESIELARSFAHLLEQRHGTLQSTAYGVCRDSVWAGFTVVFAYRPERFPDSASEANQRTSSRAVTMDSAYQHLRVEHREMALATVDQGRHGCHRSRGQ